MAENGYIFHIFLRKQALTFQANLGYPNHIFLVFPQKTYIVGTYIVLGCFLREILFS